MHYLVIILLSVAPLLLASLPFVHSSPFVLSSSSSSLELSLSLCVILSPPRNFNNRPSVLVFCCGS